MGFLDKLAIIEYLSLVSRKLRKEVRVSNRKPYNENAGYVASRHNIINYGWVVIYVAAEQGIDVGTDKYATVCEKHGTTCGTTSVARARSFLKFPEFCEECMDEARALGMI
jgi:hypothetical protein